MSTESQNKSFGRYLKSVRTGKGITLQEISSRTRIGVELLMLLEEENHERLPAEVFVKGFVRAYAKTVEADGDLALRRYQESLQTFMDAAQFESDLEHSSDVFWPRLGIGILVLAVIIGVSVLLFSMGSDSDQPAVPAARERTAPAEKAPEPAPTAPPAAKPSVSEVKAAPPASTPRVPEDTAAPVAAEAAAPVTAPAPDADSPVSPVETIPPAAGPAQNLVILADEDTWLKIGIDGEEPNEYYLTPGDRLELRAVNQFDLFIGNAGGIDLQLNGEPVSIPDRSGQVITRKLP